MQLRSVWELLGRRKEPTMDSFGPRKVTPGQWGITAMASAVW